MNITTIALLSLALSGLLYLFVAWKIHRQSTSLDDQLPITTGNNQARVKNSSEFSSATVATTISLATVILAFTELAGYLGTWLFWTVLTTSTGIFLVRLAAPVIWRKLDARGAVRPTLHEFLGDTFQSTWMSKGAAICTSLGFIGALAVELTVGAHFLVGLVPQLPKWLALLLICGIGVGYTMLGGFRAVVITDRIQMKMIWLAIVALALLISINIDYSVGVTSIAGNITPSLYDFSWREGLGAFLIGIAIINIPSFLGDMSMWQRISASRDERTVREGLKGSVLLSFFSWGALVAIACGLVILVVPKEGENPLVTFLLQQAQMGNMIISFLIFIVMLGLFSASLSTASTQLVAAGHSIHTDLIRGSFDKHLLAHSTIELKNSRLIMMFSALSAVIIVECLRMFGFTITDLVFAVYGAQLGLVPVVVAAITLSNERLRLMGRLATAAVLGGFAAGWGAAFYGKWTANENLVFLAPAASLGVSCLLVIVGIVMTKRSVKSDEYR